MVKRAVVKKAKELRNQGMSWTKIGEELGVNQGTICHYVLNSKGGEKYRSTGKVGKKTKKSKTVKMDFPIETKIKMINIITIAEIKDEDKIKMIQNIVNG